MKRPIKKYHIYLGEYNQILRNPEGKEFIISEKVTGYINLNNPLEYFVGCRFGKDKYYNCHCREIIMNKETFDKCITLTRDMGKMK